MLGKNDLYWLKRRMDRDQPESGFISGVFYELQGLETVEFFEGAEPFCDGRKFVTAVRNGSQHSFATPEVPPRKDIERLEKIIREYDEKMVERLD